MSDPLPTKTVRAPDGSLIHYPDLPGVGEKYQPPSAAAHEVHGQQSTQPPDPRPTSSASNESWRERVMSAARSAVERAGLYGHAAVNALVLDDWKALTDAHSSTLSASKAGAGLASWAIPEGKVAEIAGHAIVKAGEFAAAHAAEQSAEHAIASGVEHAAEHTQEAVVAGKKWAERTSNQKLAEQHPTNPSTIWDRPLTAAERGRAFKNADDATAFMGPATERGGELKDWHHNVEKVHADKYGHFPAEQVHNTENVMPVPRAAHRGEDGISAEFNRTDRRLGVSPREDLRGKPWEEHVERGELALRDRGLDPDALRAETRARFAQRLELHDRLHGLAKGHETTTEITLGRGTLGVVVHEGQLQNSDARSQTSARSDGANSWSPDMPFEDFAKLQARIRGGSQTRETAHGLSYRRDGVETTLPAGRRLEGTIQHVDGDRIVQHVGRGNTVTWSREELGAHFKDQNAFDAAMQPGNMVNIGVSRNGAVDAQQQVPGHGWESLSQQPLSQWQQFQAPDLGHGHGR